ncbi:MAG: MGMT family protein [Candidatus Bathyarchaeota archaeon]|nr:MGMT family protein [Candidatus Bathyarchaeota archaeon]
MPKPKLSWTEKLNDSKGLPKIEAISGNMSKKWGTGTVVIPAPQDVNALMRKVPKGKLTTINDVRAALARKYHATIACPITTGIFSWVAAHAAEEQRQKGVTDITPYWRTLKSGGLVNEKYPGGLLAQKRLLEDEGHVVVHKGKRVIVQDFENAHVTL